MSAPGAPEPALLVFGLLLSPGVHLDGVLSALAGRFGPLGAVAAERPFSHSSYYEREMGTGLRRAFVGTGRAVDPGELPRLKLEANALEERWAEAGRRRVNLDPGLLGLTQLVLASLKPSGHRVYLGQGVYAEVEYVFKRGTFERLPWTYGDYAEADVIEFFNELREAHRVGRRGPRTEGSPGPRPTGQPDE
ncbi:MAG: DUF4416 family protein [Deltaproteobacteria bacterium]|nr:DUF4416 family protein [Deltaproteobacteria bacterium]